MKNTKNFTNFDWDKSKEIQSQLSSLNHRLSIRMMDLLVNSDKPLSVTDIYVALRVEQSVASQRLKIFKKTGLVKTTRKGKFIYYSINYDRLNQINLSLRRLGWSIKGVVTPFFATWKVYIII